MRTLWLPLLILAASAAAAADCGNCHGARMVGPGPVRLPCPVCDGTGVVDDDPAKPPCHETAGTLPRPVVARIEASEGPSRIGGSGVLVAANGRHGVVLTNWHVVRSHRDGLRVHFPDGSASAATVLRSDDVWDLAALLVAKPGAAPVTIAAAAPQQGDRLTIAGYGPHPFAYREDAGPCTDYLSPVGSHPQQLVELRATARQGDSGGPIFNDRGELAGVLFGARSGLTCGPCSTRLRAFLAGVQWPSDSCRDGKCHQK